MTIQEMQLDRTSLTYAPANPAINHEALSQPTVFVDRDGVINQNRSNHVLSWQDFEFVAGSILALASLHRAGYQVIVVTNQAAIARKLFSIHELELIHQRMQEAIEEGGGKVKGIFYCIHLPTADCACRKPRPGLLFEAAEKFNIELTTSWLVGDHTTDMQAAVAAGCKPLLVLTGRGQTAYETWQQNQDSTGPGVYPPLTVKANLLEAVDFILAKERIMV
ncbi:MAG: histidinol-phosphate phosphatase family protein [Chloroflexi bacterium]|jgi:D-glycero-D-manno-heptose 1,7-bisphosphate phosphatase|nr:histidinol-phosphate phosphatase family protein [Chloroflexota bacterium]